MKTAALVQEKSLLQNVEVPILTISATSKVVIEAEFGADFYLTEHEVVLSRAHYSMALSVLVEALRQGKSAWVSDPTNFVSRPEWLKVLFTESLGKLIARNSFLRHLKASLDQPARSHFPLSKSIDQPLVELVKDIKTPIISLHYEIGNKLQHLGKMVIQVVTDPHIRPQYLEALPSRTSVTSPATVVYCVFDLQTKKDTLSLAQSLQKRLSPDQVIVTGPPVDPRVVAIGRYKKKVASSTSKFNPSQPLKLALTTGGLGQNLAEIKTLLRSFNPEFIGDQPGSIQLLLYAGTHKDFAQAYQDFAHSLGLGIGAPDNPTAPIRLLYDNNLPAANELLINYLFPWANVIIGKPSGDMAYDSIASGCPYLMLEPWGEWEEHIMHRFIQKDIGHRLDTNHFSQEIQSLTYPDETGVSWIERAAQNIQALPEKFSFGTPAILKTQAILM